RGYGTHLACWHSLFGIGAIGVVDGCDWRHAALLHRLAHQRDDVLPPRVNLRSPGQRADVELNWHPWRPGALSPGRLFAARQYPKRYYGEAPVGLWRNERSVGDAIPLITPKTLTSILSGVSGGIGFSTGNREEPGGHCRRWGHSCISQTGGRQLSCAWAIPESGQARVGTQRRGKYCRRCPLGAVSVSLMRV